MALSMHAASVPVFKQLLASLADLLGKAEAHATEKKIDPAVLLQTRLFPDMFPLVRQVQIACDFAKSVPARLAVNSAQPCSTRSTKSASPWCSATCSCVPGRTRTASAWPLRVSASATGVLPAPGSTSVAPFAPGAMTMGRALEQGGSACLIGQTAMRFGFTHMGDFSRAYRQAFGQTPRQTLAQS